MFLKIDNWLLNQLEYCIDIIQKITGQNNWFWSKITLTLWAIINIITGDYFIKILGITIFICLFGCSIFFEKASEKNLANGLGNKNKIILWPVRVFFLGFIIGFGCVTLNNFFYDNNDYKNLYVLLMLFIYELWLYLISIDTKPPCQSSIKAWLKSLKPKPAPRILLNKNCSLL